MIRPSTKLEVALISHNIFSIKNLSIFPSIKIDIESYSDYNYILFKCERYEIILNENIINPTKEFEHAIEKALEKINDLPNWIKDTTNDNLEIIEFDDIIPLYKILKEKQQRRIDDILKDNFRIIITGITALKVLDNNNNIHYERIDLESSLKDENYEIFGSIISHDNIN
ncbi:hypothetical protein C1645_822473 [Glomus cerebriforme]|uniref:Uncharacterized protein n=1 Tax=Glomus cerebriforme TaxID=658196 RepID=A0A397SY86_9GLOM|nr:hypothetical protein C1645_822473 [Glomus cerebriforme]